MFTRINQYYIYYLWLNLFTPFNLCLHLFTPVYSFLPMFTPFYPCLLVFNYVYTWLPMYTPVYLFTRVYLSLLAFIYVEYSLIMQLYIWLPLFTRVYLFLFMLALPFGLKKNNYIERERKELTFQLAFQDLLH